MRVSRDFGGNKLYSPVHYVQKKIILYFEEDTSTEAKL